MPEYRFRLKFHLSEDTYINSDAEEVTLARAGSGPRIWLTGGRGTSIKKVSWPMILGGPFATEGEAHAAAERTWQGVLVWAVRNRVGIDLGGRPPRGGITASGRAFFQDRIGRPVRHDVHGIDVYEHHGGPTVFIGVGDARLRVGRVPGPLVDQMTAEFVAPRSLNPKQLLAAEILSASYFDLMDRSRFITQMTAIEALLEPRERSAAAQAVVVRWIKSVSRNARLDQGTKAAMRGSLEWLKHESIGQAGRALAARLLKGKVYNDQPPDRFFRVCYDVRSSILHDGREPRGVNFERIRSEAQRLVCDLVDASLAPLQDGDR
jgi:hypothetical protein